MITEEKFPPREILIPWQPKDELLAGICVYCGGSLGAPYQEDLMHWECSDLAEAHEENWPGPQN